MPLAGKPEDRPEPAPGSLGPGSAPISQTRRICLLSIAAAAAGLAGPAAGAGPDLLRFMHGTWRGGGLILILDMERLLANLDPAKPFQRDAVIIRNITGSMVFFSVGDRRFIGLFEGDELALAGDGLSGTFRLERIPPGT